MAGNVKVKINWDAVARATRPAIEQFTSQITARAGEGFAGDVIQGTGRKPRPHGAVRADTYTARARNARENTLLKAVHG